MSSYKSRGGAYIQGIWQVYWCWHFKWVCYGCFLHLSDLHLSLCAITHITAHKQDPLLRCWHTSKSGRAELTPEINMSPFHARPCKAAARPDIFMRRVFATIADVSAEQLRHFCRDQGCQGRVNYDPIAHSITSTDQPVSSEMWGRRGGVSTQKGTTDWQTKEGKIDLIWNVCLFSLLGKEYI